MKSFRTYKEATEEPIKPRPFEAIERLPIDSHMQTILSHIRSHRCTVIHGETGNRKYLINFYLCSFKINLYNNHNNLNEI